MEDLVHPHREHQPTKNFPSTHEVRGKAGNKEQSSQPHTLQAKHSWV